MKIISLFFLTLSCISLNCLGQINKKDFPFDWRNDEIAAHLMTGNDFKLFTPSIEDIILSKNLTNIYIDSLSRTSKNQILYYSTSKYYRQYVGYFDSNGDKIILINAFCSKEGSSEELTKKWIMIKDGGSCYFNIKINLNTKTCFDFLINGEA
jgi:hypothetical protein